MAFFSDRSVLYLLLLSLLTNKCLTNETSDESESSADRGERVLEKFIDESLGQLDISERFDENLSHNVDTVADYLNYGSDQSEALQDAIAEAVNIHELLDAEEAYEATTTPSPSTRTNGFAPPSRSPGLLDLMDRDEHNPHIVHAKRSVNLEKLTNTTLNKLHTMPRGEREFLERVSQEIVCLEDDGREVSFLKNKSITEFDRKKSPARILLRLVMSVWQRGTDVLDRFYKAPNFIMEVPVLGEYLRELRREGEPLYKAVNLLRHSVYLLKLMPFNPNRTSVKDLSPVEQQHLEESKRMISKAGAFALKSIAFKIIAKYAHKAISEDTTEEIVTRMFYTILGVMLSVKK